MSSKRWFRALVCSMACSAPALAQLDVARNALFDQTSAFSSLALHESDDRLGAALAAGDFNGDGWDDLAVGSPGEDIGALVDAGAVFVIYGGQDGLDQRIGSVDGNLAEAINQDEIEAAGGAFCGGAEATDLFGEVLAAGDFDDDGFDDLVIGVPHEDAESQAVADTGIVVVLYGSFDGLRGPGGEIDFQLWDEDRPLGSTAIVYGSALAVGDFDGDDVDDLAIGAPGEFYFSMPPLRSGTVSILYGIQGSGLTEGGRQLLYEPVVEDFGGPESDDRFGASLAAGDFDGDGDDDLAIAVPGERVEADVISHGAVQVARGGPTGLALADEALAPLGVLDDQVLALASGDFGDDGLDDLAIGAPNWDTEGETSRVVSFRGMPPGTPLEGSTTWSGDFSEFGIAVAAGDFGQSGLAAIVAGAPGANVVGTYQHNVGGGPTIRTWDQDDVGMVDSLEPGDRFGAALAVGEFGLGEGLDLAIGVPLEDTGATTDGGAFHVIFNRFLFGNGFEPGEEGEW